MNHWLRWHHGTAQDPKWRSIKRRANEVVSRNVTAGHGVSRSDNVTIVTVTHVLSVWATMLEAASQAANRGTLEGWDPEDIAELLEVETEIVKAIYDAMQGKVLDGDRLTGWEKRQVKQEDTKAADRKRRQREKERDASAITDGHDVSRDVTPRHDRGEEIREESPLTPQGEVRELRSLTDDLAGRVGTSPSQSTQWATGKNLIGRALSAGISREALQRAADEAAKAKTQPGRTGPPGPAYVVKIAERLQREWNANPDSAPSLGRPDCMKLKDRYRQRGEHEKAQAWFAEVTALGDIAAADKIARQKAREEGIHL